MFLLSAMLLLTGISAFSQKYKTFADTAKLNKEYIEVSNDIVTLTSKLTVAQNDLQRYQNKADEAVAVAQKAAVKSSDQASKSIDGDVGDAKKARRRAKSAVREAKDANHASNNLKDQEKKTANLKSQLLKKQQRLQELEKMRTGIQNIAQ